MPLPAAALTAGAFVRANWRLFAVAAIAATAWWWHASEVRAAAQAAEKTTHAHYAGVLANIAQQTATAEKEYRALENRTRTAIEKEAKDGQQKIDRARADADSARAVAAGLQQQLAHYRGAATATARHPGSANAGQGESGKTPLDLLAELLDRHTRELIEVGAYADELNAVATTCEAVYESTARILNGAARVE